MTFYGFYLCPLTGFHSNCMTFTITYTKFDDFLITCITCRYLGFVIRWNVLHLGLRIYSQYHFKKWVTLFSICFYYFFSIQIICHFLVHVGSQFWLDMYAKIKTQRLNHVTINLSHAWKITCIYIMSSLRTETREWRSVSYFIFIGYCESRIYMHERVPGLNVVCT